LTAITTSYRLCATYDTRVRVALQRTALCACASIVLISAAPASGVTQRTVTITLQGSGKAFWKLNRSSETSRLALRYKWHGTLTFNAPSSRLTDPKHRHLSVWSTGRLTASWDGNFISKKAGVSSACQYRGTRVKVRVRARLARGRAGNTVEVVLHPRAGRGFFDDKGRRATVSCSNGTVQSAPPHFAPSWFFRDNLQDHGRFTSETATIVLPGTVLPQGLATVAFPSERGRNDSDALGHLGWNNQGETVVRVR
jgi:hypothetical protein